jgi:hypothetical protein
MSKDNNQDPNAQLKSYLAKANALADVMSHAMKINVGLAAGCFATFLAIGGATILGLLVAIIAIFLAYRGMTQAEDKSLKRRGLYGLALSGLAILLCLGGVMGTTTSSSSNDLRRGSKTVSADGFDGTWYRAGSCDELSLDGDTANATLWYLTEGKSEIGGQQQTPAAKTAAGLAAQIQQKKDQLSRSQAGASKWKSDKFTLDIGKKTVVESGKGKMMLIPAMSVNEGSCAGAIELDGDQLRVYIESKASSLPQPRNTTQSGYVPGEAKSATLKMMKDTACKQSGDCDSYKCVSGYCQDGAVGNPCKRGGDCEDYKCIKGVCQSMDNGTICEKNGHCETSKCVAGVCLPMDDGTPCKRNYGCDSGKCIGGVCLSKEDGTRCKKSYDCDSSKCSNGICTSKADGTPCEKSWDCDSDCVNGICGGKKTDTAAAKPLPQICHGHAFLFTRKKPASCTPPSEQAKVLATQLQGEIKSLESAYIAVKETERKKRNTAGSGAKASKYPHACDDLDPKIHAEIKGIKGQCVPSGSAWWLSKANDGAKSASIPSRYSDDNDFALLGKPNKLVGESSSLSSRDKRAARAAVKKRLYATNNVSCDFKFIDVTRKLTADCEFERGELIASGGVSFKKKQKCTRDCMRPGSCGSCSSHSDCDGWLCGCSRSRCFFGRCTRCPADCTRTCEDPKFIKKGGKALKVSIKVPKDRVDEAKSIASSSGRLTFKAKSVYRKVFIKKEKDWEGKWEKSVEHDTGYYVKASPVRLMVATKQGNTFSLKGRGPWKFKSTLSGTQLSVSCTDTKCSAKKVR